MMTEKDSTIHPHHIMYCNFGDSPYGGKDRVVGYHSFVFTRVEAKTGFSLDDEEKLILKGIARNAIKATLEGKAYHYPPHLTEKLKTKCGVFVSLHEHGGLRGCIGHFGEDTPLNEFHPGTRCLSLSCMGCNFHCLNCQNHDISQVLPSDVKFYELSPQEVVSLALEHHLPGIAYTYTEPLTYYEYIYDIAKEAHAHGIWNILVSAGYINSEPLQELLPYIDAANIDLKAFADEVYKHQCGGHLQPVLDTLLAMQKAGVHLEITNLLIPGVNDREEMIREMCRWLVSNGFAKNPLHFSRFFPLYKMQDASPTPRETLYQAKMIAQEEGIKSIYLGNI